MELSILALLMVIFSAWLGGAIVSRLGYPAVLGELLIGILFGPAVLGLLGDSSWLAAWMGIDGSYASLEVIGQLGVLLLLLYIGMEIDPKELGKASWSGFLAAMGGFITPFGLGLLVALAFERALTEGIFVGIALGVTSLAVNSRIVLDLRILDTRIAHVLLAGALIADTLCLLIFAGLVPFANPDAVSTGAGMLALKAAGFFIGTAILGIWIFPLAARLLRRLGINNLLTFFMLLLMIALLFGELAELAGLHAILGTFVAGLFLREGMLEPRMQRELNELVRVVSIGMLAPIFFVLTGFQVSFDVVTDNPGLLVAVCAVAIVGKVAGTMVFYLPTGFGWREGLVIGLGSNGRGAVEIVLAQIALKLDLIDQQMFSVLVIMAILTTATVPLVLKWGTDWLRRRGELVRSADKRTGVIIVGATATARALAKLLGEGRRVVLIDSNLGRVETARAEGLTALAGNALDNEILAQAGAPEAGRLLAMTTNAEINALAARHAKESFLVPHVHVSATGRGGGGTRTLDHLGASALFGRHVNLAEWDRLFERGEANVERLPLGDRTPAQALATLEPMGPVLPMAIERLDAGGEKRIEPWHGGAECAPQDRLVVARARMAPEPRKDRFDDLLRVSPVLDFREPLELSEFLMRAATALSPLAGESAERIHALLMERESQGSTVLTPGLAVPHIFLPGEKRYVILAARCSPGVKFHDDPEPVHTLFVLAGSQDERNFHLKALSAIAQVWQAPDFERAWREAESPEELRQALIDAPRHRV